MTTGTDTDVIVIGAGLAGLGAATRLRERGLRAIVLEASDRIGGRAWTTHPPQLGGAWFDMGAIWLHDAEHNPLVPIAVAAGETLLRSDAIRQERTFIGSRLATPAELADYEGAWSRFEAAADRLLQEQGDVPLSDVTRHLPDDRWAPTIEAWEGPVICVADGDQFSARDWRTNALGGSNLVPQGGIGSFVSRVLGQGLDVRRNTPVHLLRWEGPGGRVTAETASGSISAGACIVTASTGVLRSGALRFDPGLPPDTLDALDALPMGLALKIALWASGPDRLDLPTHCSVDRQVPEGGGVLMPFQCWPFGRDYVQGWLGGSLAWDLARAGDAAIVDYAIGYLRAIFGGRVDRLFTGGPHLVVRWDADPWVRGAYSFVPPGKADARQRLGLPLGDGRLLFAGEACHTPYAGTLAGAWLSGRDAGASVRVAVA